MQTADIIMLCAGTSSRMGRTNKMLLPYRGMTLASYSCMEALKFLSSLEDGGHLIVVTGYRHRELLSALKPCMAFVEASDRKVQLIVTRNENYRSGQFSSTRKGAEELRSGVPFFISLADMPDVEEKHYGLLGDMPEGAMAVRPFVEETPGHPVLHSPLFREKIINSPDSCTIRALLKNETVCEKHFTDRSWIKDLDTEEDLRLSQIL